MTLRWYQPRLLYTRKVCFTQEMNWFFPSILGLVPGTLPSCTASSFFIFAPYLFWFVTLQYVVIDVAELFSINTKHFTMYLSRWTFRQPLASLAVRWQKSAERVGVLCSATCAGNNPRTAWNLVVTSISCSHAICIPGSDGHSPIRQSARNAILQSIGLEMLEVMSENAEWFWILLKGQDSQGSLFIIIGKSPIAAFSSKSTRAYDACYCSSSRRSYIQARHVVLFFKNVVYRTSYVCKSRAT